MADCITAAGDPSPAASPTSGGPAPAASDTATADALVRATKPGTKRLLLTASVLFSFLAGLPFLLSSVEIHRSPLPPAVAIEPPSFPCRLNIIFPSSDAITPGMDAAIHDEITRRLGDGASGVACGDLSVTVSSDLTPEMNENAHSIVVEKKEGNGVEVVVGSGKRAWIKGVDGKDAVSVIGELYVDVFMGMGLGGGSGIGKGEFMPVGSDGSLVLSFSLLNAEPKDWLYDWQFHEIGETILSPVVDALAPVAQISIESQVLYHTPKSSMSRWDDKLLSHVLQEGDLPFFVNSNEWHLDTSISASGRSKVLQFVVYIPSAEKCPLSLQLQNGVSSKTNAFISPMWGGVVIWNPPECISQGDGAHVIRRSMSREDLQKVLQIFVGQLRLLFGIRSEYPVSYNNKVYKFQTSERGFTDWELDILYRRHAHFNLLSCSSTLISLSSLVESLPRMIVMDEIGKQVELSVEAASLAHKNASLGISEASSVSAMKARALAEDAFFHPSISSISYSSAEHYFAIYMPFFAPVCVHVLLAALKELKRYKAERAKYQAYLARKTKLD